MTAAEVPDVAPVADAVAARARERSHEALKQVYRDQYAALANFALRLTGSHAQAEDVVQEAFARLLARRLVVAEPLPYLYRTVANLANDVWRRRQRDARLGRALPVAEEVPAVDPGLRDAVRRLPRAERTAITLYYFADLPVAQVAAVMGKPAGTVRWLLASARGRLAHDLGA